MKGFLLLMTILLAFPVSALAHAVGVEAKLKGGTVSVEAYYDDDTPAADAKVTVEDDSRKVLVEGKTDVKGRWSFPAPKPGKYMVRVNAGAGHVAKTMITVPTPIPTSVPTAQRQSADTQELGPVSISDGPTREVFTGAMRWVMAAVGVAIIAGVAVLSRWVMAARRAKEQS